MMTGAQYAGGQAIPERDGTANQSVFTVERTTLNGITGWALMRNGEQYEFLPTAQARIFARKILFSR